MKAFELHKRSREELEKEKIMTNQEKLEQVANLLALWKARLPEYEKPTRYKDVDPYTAQEMVYIRFKDCIDELEAILTGKPLP